MFLFHAGRHLEELERHAPAIARVARSACASSNSDLDSSG